MMLCVKVVKICYHFNLLMLCVRGAQQIVKLIQVATQTHTKEPRKRLQSALRGFRMVQNEHQGGPKRVNLGSWKAPVGALDRLGEGRGGAPPFGGPKMDPKLSSRSPSLDFLADRSDQN